MLFIGVLIFIILTFVRPQDFFPAVKDFPLVSIIIGLVASGWLFRRLNYKKKKFVKAPQNIIMIWFWVIIVTSTLSVKWLGFTLNTFIDWGKYVLIYFLIINIVNTKERIKIVIWTIVLCMAITALMGILQFYGNDITGTGMFKGERIRGVGIFDTNQLAYTLAFCLPLIFGLFISTYSFFSKLFLTFIFFMYSYCIYLTQSRGGLICAVYTLLLTFFIFSRKKVIQIFGIIFCASGFFILLKFAPRLSSTFGYQTDESAIGRIDVWGDGLSTIKNKLFLGIGKDQFQEYFRIAAHNGYIQTMVELSLVGLFLWLALYYFSIRNLRLMDTSSYNQKDILNINFSKALQISLYAYLIGSFFQSSAYYITLYILFALIVALQNLTHLNIEKKITAISLGDIRNIFLAEIAIILVIRFIIKQVY